MICRPLERRKFSVFHPRICSSSVTTVFEDGQRTEETSEEADGFVQGLCNTKSRQSKLHRCFLVATPHQFLRAAEAGEADQGIEIVGRKRKKVRGSFER